MTWLLVTNSGIQLSYIVVSIIIGKKFGFTLPIIILLITSIIMLFLGISLFH